MKKQSSHRIKKLSRIILESIDDEQDLEKDTKEEEEAKKEEKHAEKQRRKAGK